MLEMNKTASYKQHNQMVQNSRNEQIENVDEPKNMKAKPKRQYKCKNINETTQQLEDQLAQCRARLVIMEDTNRDYRNTINLLRMQSEESTIDKSNLKTYQPNCGCSNNSQEQTINKVDMMLNNFRLEMENRDLRIKHQMEMNELRNKLQIMELQKKVGMWQRPGSHEYYPYNNIKKMLDVVSDWCSQWKLDVNQSKSNVVHFRNPSIDRSNFNFTCSRQNIAYATSYKYVGMWLDEHLTFDKAVRELSKSASRALGALYGKFISAGGMTHSVYSKLYSYYG
ncbi:Hypothetical predicted protein [Mytilus galloprovincialis]|uniref:Reverse transcriptase domain-containing protein n=1 Tax=Mytilus galloprovincialis TaxID=29158 RepID=A0A8B6C2P4_MYTGA|nr:Hypothetical predicted protein [Mytilus galloprovincialis]